MINIRSLTTHPTPSPTQEQIYVKEDGTLRLVREEHSQSQKIQICLLSGSRL